MTGSTVVVVAAATKSGEDSLVFKSVNRKDRQTGVRGWGRKPGIQAAVLPLIRLPIWKAHVVSRYSESATMRVAAPRSVTTMELRVL